MQTGNAVLDPCIVLIVNIKIFYNKTVVTAKAIGPVTELCNIGFTNQIPFHFFSVQTVEVNVRFLIAHFLCRLCHFCGKEKPLTYMFKKFLLFISALQNEKPP